MSVRQGDAPLEKRALPFLPGKLKTSATDFTDGCTAKRSAYREDAKAAKKSLNSRRNSPSLSVEK
jgi:hypothetical protein